MSSVYLAMQESLQREVALKILNPVFTADSQFTERFLTEGRTIGKLQHPHIVSVHDIGVTDFHHYIAMEYLEGGNLRYRMDAGLDPERSAGIVRKIAEALAYAHRQGFVHRDIKPENIMFTDSGHPVLTDFGVAKLLREATRSTCTGITMGTPFYISPEQARGGNVDGRSDIYSLGCVFYELLTGSPPYESEDSLAVLYSHVHDPLPTLPGKLSTWQPAIDKMLSKDPDERFTNAEELVQYLNTHSQKKTATNNVLAHSSISSALGKLAQFTTASRKALRVNKWKSPVAIASAAFAGAVAGGVLLFSFLNNPSTIETAVNQSAPNQSPYLAYPSGFLRPVSITDNYLGGNMSDLPGVNIWQDEQSDSQKEYPDSITANTRATPEFIALMDKLRDQIQHNNLTAPAGDNAWETYSQISQNYPDKPEVKEIPKSVAERYLQLAIYMEPKDKSLANTYVERGLKVLPEHDGLLRMKSRLNPLPVTRSAKVVDKEAPDSVTVTKSGEPKVSASVPMSTLVTSTSSGGDDYLTAERYFYGVGISKNIDKAAYWYQIAADKGYPEAQSSLGVLYATGNGVTKDIDKAVYWLQKAAGQGVAEAQYNLGLSYLLGKGHPVNLDTGKDWIREAAKQGYRKAFIALGWIFDNGIGVQQSVKKAFKWHAKAIRKDISGVLPWSEKKEKVKAVVDWEKVIKPYKSS